MTDTKPQIQAIQWTPNRISNLQKKPQTKNYT